MASTGFSTIVRGVRDHNPHAAVEIPSAWLAGILRDLGLGKLRVFQPFEVAERYSTGCPRRYYLAVRVFFDAVSSAEMKAALDAGQSMEVVYAEKGSPHYRTGRPLPRNLSITVHGDTGKEVRVAKVQEAVRADRIAAHEARKAAKAVAVSKGGNMFAALGIDDDDDDDEFCGLNDGPCATAAP